MAVTCTFTDESQDTGAGNAYTFASQSFGTEDADRQILVLGYIRDTADPVIATFTIGGVAATQLALTETSGAGIAFAYIADVPTGTTGSVVIDTNQSGINAAIAVYSVIGADQTTPLFDSATDTGGAQDVSMSIDCPAGGAVAAFAVSHGSDTTMAWTGVTEDFEGFINDGVLDTNYSGASDEFAVAQVGLSITGNWGAGTTGIGVAVALQPPAAQGVPRFMANYRRRRNSDN